MSKHLLLIIAIFIMPFSISAQYKWDVGGGFGPTQFFGSLGGGSGHGNEFLKDINLGSTRFNFDGFVRRKLSPTLSLQADFTWSRLSGDDKYATDPVRYLRNLSFRNDVLSLDVTAHLILWDIKGLVQNLGYRLDFTTYALAGVGGYHHNPKALYDGTWIKLENLHLNGTGYPLYGMDIPMGAGAYFTINRKNKIGIEFLWRKTFTKYMDDVGDSKYIDPKKFTGPDAAVAAALENRNLVSTDPTNPKVISAIQELPYLATNYQTGGLRGYSKADNWWFTANVTYAHSIKGKSKFYKHRYRSRFRRRFKRRSIRAKF